jgi:glycosyltransferase involved in cell wall biosynthesis
MSVAEAMLLRVPIVASDCDAHKLLLREGKFGYLFKNKNAKSLATVIETALADKDIKQKVAAGGDYAKLHLTATKMWETTEKLYQKYISSNNNVLR